jgi:hypothetical protein
MREVNPALPSKHIDYTTGEFMNIKDLTIGEAQQIASMFSVGSVCRPSPFKVGEKYLIRTVTHIQTGRIKEVVGDFLVLDDAAWIADTGRFHDALKTGELNEIEPFVSGCIVSQNAIIDAAVWERE